MLVVCGIRHAHFSSVVMRSIFGHWDYALRPESLFPQETAIVCAHTTRLVDGCHHRSACHFAVPVDNTVEGHS